jgi:hypothetical protein
MLIHFKTAHYKLCTRFHDYSKPYHHNTHKELYSHLNLHSFQLVSILRPCTFSKTSITETMAEYIGFIAINLAVSDTHLGNNKKLKLLLVDINMYA